jgi:putative transposase
MRLHHLIFDRDAIFSPAVAHAVKAMGIKPLASPAYRSLWQNPGAERWIGSCRRELLERVVVFGRSHLVRLVASYITYRDIPFTGLTPICCTSGYGRVPEKLDGT